MSLKELVDNSRTDKNTTHSYLPLYQKLLISKKETAKNVLEVGIGDWHQGITNGGSIKLWHDYFTNATVHALDICSLERIWDGIKNNDRIAIYSSSDAYNDDFFITNFLNKNVKYDFMLDDGPHTLESMKQVIKLYSQIMTDDGILIIEHALAIDALKSPAGRVCGVTLHVIGAGSRDGVGRALARAVVVATGGLGQVYSQTTNPAVSTGDGVALALRAGAKVADVEFVQFHPTVLWRDLANRGQQPLISEAVRGEGAILLNNKNEQFMVGKHPQADLAPRDVVAIEIFNQMQISGQPHVWLDATRIKDFTSRFPTIYASCIKNGIDPTKEKIPVAPASHYASGGVLVDLNGKSSVDGLYICGESACTGAHGANRLASNSLLEGLVFGARIAAALSNDLPAQQQPVEDGKSVLLDPKILLPLQIAMSEGAGVLRSEASLTKTLQTLEELSKLTSKDPRIEAWEATNLHLLATVIVKSALLRNESRGSHWRSDYPQTQSNWVSRIIQQIDSDGNWQSKVEVI